MDFLSTNHILLDIILARVYSNNENQHFPQPISCHTQLFNNLKFSWSFHIQKSPLVLLISLVFLCLISSLLQKKDKDMH